MMRENNDDGVEAFEYDGVDIESIEVHWQHPRTELENPVLLVWPHPARDKWAAEVEGDTAWVVCHTTLYEDSDGDIESHARQVNPNDAIPSCVAEALLQYDSEYGPVENVVNPYTDEYDTGNQQGASNRSTGDASLSKQ